MGRREVAIVVVDPRPYMTYAPFLPEVAAGSIDARHVVAPHRFALPGIDSLQGKVGRIEHAERRAEITPEEGDPYWVTYDRLVVGLGAVARTLPIPGLAEVGVGFKNVEEAISLRNHVLSRIDLAASTWDPDLRRRMLTFVFVGGGFAGIEALAEIEDMARDAVVQLRDDQPRRPELRARRGHAADPAGGERRARRLHPGPAAQAQHRHPPVHVPQLLRGPARGALGRHRDGRRDHRVDGGVKPNPVLQDRTCRWTRWAGCGAPRPCRWCGEDGSVVDGAWAAGDCAAVPDLENPGTFCPPNAQHALREAKLLGENLAKHLRSVEPKEYRHKNVGTVASLGMHQGVAQMLGRFKVRGLLAWVLHRTYHLYAMPTLNRKFRIASGWTATLLFRREVVALGSITDPRAEFRAASVPPKAARAASAAAPDGRRPGDRGDGRAGVRAGLSPGAVRPRARSAIRRPRGLQDAPSAPVAQLAEAAGLNPAQCRFEPCRGHTAGWRRGSLQGALCPGAVRSRPRPQVARAHDRDRRRPVRPGGLDHQVVDFPDPLATTSTGTLHRHPDPDHVTFATKRRGVVQRPAAAWTLTVV